MERISSVQKQVVDPRNVFLTEAGKSRAYDFAKEPFSVRVKDFTPLAGTEGFIRSFIPKLCHECDGTFLVYFRMGNWNDVVFCSSTGLIFQPSRARYESCLLYTSPSPRD